jgi:bifunctional non-homologous end joining protein LigD
MDNGAKPDVDGLPEHLQPGRIATMQPVDAPRGRGYYIASDLYWGQPKRDGNRLVIVATPDQVFYQGRSTKLREAPNLAMDYALREAARRHGPFVLDGELYYVDYKGGEHRTAAQAATANIEAGYGEATVEPTYAIFRALYVRGHDLTGSHDELRLAAGLELASILYSYDPGRHFESLRTYRTADEKATLA